MTYPGWAPRTLMTWLVCLLLGALLYPVMRMDAHWGGWLVGMDNLQARAQTGYGIPADVHAFTLQTMTDSHAVAVDVHRDVEIAGGTENMARQVLRELRDRLPSILTDVQRTSSRMPDLVSHGVQLEDSFRDAGDELEIVLEKFTITEDELNALLKSGWKLVDDADQLVASHQVNELLDGAAKITQNTAAMTGDFRAWEHQRLFPGPYQGKFKTLHRIFVVGRGVVTLAQPVYYGAGVFSELKR